VSSAVSEYLASVTAAPAFSSIQGVLGTGVDPRILAGITETSALLAPATTTPGYFSQLPLDVRTYFASIQVEEESISKSVVSSLSSVSTALEASKEASEHNGAPGGLEAGPAYSFLAMVLAVAIGGMIML
jgi:hypothetical protein